MGTVPTGRMEAELRALYLRWLASLPKDINAVSVDHVDTFQQASTALIQRMGGQVASLGALAGFPTPKLLELSPHAGTIYNSMKQAAIQAGIQAGLNATDVARQMFNLGMDKSFNRLNRLARTETTSAYWKNGWDSIAGLPALVMVWGAEHGARTCRWCLERDGMVMESPDLRDHPNGRCTPIPTLRSQVRYKGSVRSDGEIYYDPRWDQKSVQKTPEVVDAVIGQPTPISMDVKTFGSQVDAKTAKARVSEGDWRYIDDRQKRAATLLQNDYRSEQAIKKMAKNLRETGQPGSVAIPRTWSKDFTGTVTDVTGAKYTQDNVKEAIEDAARWLVEQDPVKPRVMFKGLDVPKEKISKLFKEGGTFDTNYSSFSTDEDVARGYSSRRASQQVIVRVKNAPAVKVEGNPTADFWKKTKEHLVTGQGRITGVTEAHGGRTVYVDVTFG